MGQSVTVRQVKNSEKERKRLLKKEFDL